MYTPELQEFIRVRNFRLGDDELLKAISLEENPQLRQIEYNPSSGWYTMIDNKGIMLNFEAQPYQKKLGKEM